MAIPRYNPARRARDEFLDEEPQYLYFPPAGQGRTAFSPNISGGLAATTALELEDLAERRDNSATRAAENQYRRLYARDRAKILPFSTAADIARHQATAEVSPFAAEADIEQAQTRAAESESARRILPTKEAAALDSLERSISGEDQLKRNGIDPLAYNYHLRQFSADPKMPPKERQRQARNATLRLQNDAPFVAAIEDEALDAGDPEFRKKYLKDERDPETGARFTRVRDDADVGEVNALLRKRETLKLRQAQTREDRISHFGYVKMVNDEQDDINRQIKALVDTPDDPAMAGLKERTVELAALRKQLLADLRPGATKSGTGAPAGEATKPVKKEPVTKESYLEAAKKAAMGG